MGVPEHIILIWGTVSRDLRLGPMYKVAKNSAKFAHPRSQQLSEHDVCVVNDYAEIERKFFDFAWLHCCWQRGHGVGVVADHVDMMFA